MNGQPAFDAITRIKVTGGFLSGLDLDLSTGLVTVIGPRGSGKSTVVEDIRHGLNVMPGREGDPLRKRVLTMIDKNLAGGRVELSLRSKDGASYTVSRSAGEEPVIINGDGTPLPPSVELSHLFSAAVYSQNQIEAVADNPRYQLDLIDGFEAAELLDATRRIDRVRHELEANAARIIPLASEKLALEASLSQLDAVRQQLKAHGAQPGQDAKVVNQAHALKALRGREVIAFDQSIERLQKWSGWIRPQLGKLSSAVDPQFTQDIMAGPNSEILATAWKNAAAAVRQAEEHLAKAADALDAAGGAIQSQRLLLDRAHAQQDLAFRAVIEKHEKDLAKSAERTKLEKQHNDLLVRQRRLGEAIAEIKKLEDERAALRARLSEVRDQRFAIRLGVAKRLNAALNPSLRINVAQSADQESYRRFLESALRDAGIQHRVVAAALSKEISPDELAELVVAKDAAILAHRGGINPQQAAKVIAELAGLARLLELQAVDMDDVPTIELCDNGVYKDSSNLSTGQKCTAILPILLLEGTGPLIIDQPEDNLDNRYVYDTTVNTLQQVKGGRQLMFVTHNPNIPVLGEAEQVIVMQSDGTTGSVRKTGQVEDCRAEIIELLEGGVEAFTLRRNRYHIAQS